MARPVPRRAELFLEMSTIAGMPMIIPSRPTGAMTQKNSGYSIAIPWKSPPLPDWVLKMMDSQHKDGSADRITSTRLAVAI